MRFATFAAIAAVFSTACAVNPAPVPLSCDAEGRQLLIGNWSGEYFTPDGGRAGSIVFNFAPEDTLGYAHGDIVMAPPRGNQYLLPVDQGGISAPEETVQVLTIEFLGVVGHQVGGTLSPYRDPETGEMLNTTFEGRIEGDKISGTLTTVHTRSMQVDVGTWEVVRKHS
ncbi:MAG: hypothetical protein HY700_08175 [Gemmatimonadetes bacterium]|nr:hypothetical protein [Gemmatimonadota bacterium]